MLRSNVIAVADRDGSRRSIRVVTHPLASAFSYQHDVVTERCDCLAHQFLAVAPAVNRRGVE